MNGDERAPILNNGGRGRKVNLTLTILATFALTLVDVAQSTLLSYAAAAVLVVLIVAHLRGFNPEYFGVYAFVIAELSPIALTSHVYLALLYQALCVALLVGLTVNFDYVRSFRVHGRALLGLVAAAAVPVTLTALLWYTKALAWSPQQLLSLSALITFFALYGVLAAGAYARARASSTHNHEGEP